MDFTSRSGADDFSVNEANSLSDDVGRGSSYDGFMKIPRAFWPWLLLGTRGVLGPAMILVALIHASPWILVAGLWVGVITDIFDGIVARKLGCATDTLRLRDSQVDLVFFLCLGAVAFLNYWSVIEPWIPQILFLLAVQALEYVISLARFRKTPSSHAFAFKFFALTLLAAFTDLFMFDRAGWWLGFSLVAGLVAHADSLLILIFMPRWERDIPTAYHAWRIRKGLPISRNGLFHSVD
jgi:CDP-diacylglycerol---glycerol-3-phosphate 3-phosphatidyltransferase